MSQGNSYGQILRSSSIIGGAQAISFAIGLVRVKAVAILLGPAGVGIVGIYQSAIGVITTISGLELKASAVRAIAEANGRGDLESIARLAAALRRVVWLTGIAGWLLAMALAIPLSHWLFKVDQQHHAWALAALGATSLLAAISNGDQGISQGLRRIGDIARVQVIAALLGAVVTVGLYYWLRRDGIVAVLIANALIMVGASWWYVRKARLPDLSMSWQDVFEHSRPLLRFGAGLMVIGALTLGADLYIRGMISRMLGLEAVGWYQAAWTLSGLFAGLVLSAMGVDFYPRLTAVIQDRIETERAINDQTQIGILLALPGLLAVMAMAPWLVTWLYSARFAPAADLLVFMVAGVFGRVVSWPLSYVQLALGSGRWYVGTEASFLAVQVALVTLLLPRVGLIGAAYALAVCYTIYTLAMLWVVRRLVGFRWSTSSRRLVLIAALAILMALLANKLLGAFHALMIVGVITVTATFACIRGLLSRLGTAHSLLRWVRRVPGARWLLLNEQK